MAHAIEILMLFVQGAHEGGCCAEPFEGGYPTVGPSIRVLTVLDTSGDSGLWEHPDEFVDDMANTVLAHTKGT